MARIIGLGGALSPSLITLASDTWNCVAPKLLVMLSAFCRKAVIAWSTRRLSTLSRSA